MGTTKYETITAVISRSAAPSLLLLPSSSSHAEVLEAMEVTYFIKAT